MQDLSGKVAIITGGTRGIGLATADLLAGQGASVVVSSRRQDACDEVAGMLAGRGFSAIGCAAHMGDDAARQHLVRETIAAFGGVDFVIANAAVNPVTSSLQDMPEDAWDKILEIDLKSIWRLSQSAMPEIAKRGGGAMVLLSSIASVVASPHSGAYAVAKAGVNHLARQLAHEWGPQGIRVNAIAPGVTRTDMIRTALGNEKALEKVIGRTPLRRIAEPADIAAAVGFLVGDQSRHITGQTLVIDGGATLSAG